MKLTEIKHKFDEQGVGLAAISADTKEDSREFIEDKGITVPLLSDPALKVIGDYGVAMKGEDIAVPSVFIITKDKKIQWQYVGENMTDRPSEEEILNWALKSE
ncbi:MAG: peroxiredoxin family protein [Deltaproteobacteria bacterium]|nr:peroxiredoxin family protein [Deltaproteobacteria bacterium]